MRRGLRGEANCLYDFDRTRVVVTPFNQAVVMHEAARYMVQCGCTPPALASVVANS